MYEIISNYRLNYSAPLSKMKICQFLVFFVLECLLSCLFYFGSFTFSLGYNSILLTALVLESVITAVYHSEVLANRLGEPISTLLLVFAITVIEMDLIISIMLGAKGLETITLARDTVFAAVMLILKGIIGICIVIGSLRYRQQAFTLNGESTALITLTAGVVFVLILPNYTVSHGSGEDTSFQPLFIAVICLFLYLGFTRVQTIRHRSFFRSPQKDDTDQNNETEIETNDKGIYISGFMLVLSLRIVVMMAKLLSKDVEYLVTAVGVTQSCGWDRFTAGSRCDRNSSQK